MSYKDPEKERASRHERQRRYQERKKMAKYGPEAAGQDMRGRHGRHAAGERHARWNASTRRITSQGYIAVRVAPDHPHAWGPARLKRFKYAYEHVLVMMEHVGRPLTEDEVVHHQNGNCADNCLENLELLTRGEHSALHQARARLERGRKVSLPTLDGRQWAEMP
jgi:HNH endonuclease